MRGKRAFLSSLAAAGALFWSGPSDAALITYDYAAKLVNQIGPYDGTVWGNTVAGSFTIDSTAPLSSSGTYTGAMRGFTLAAPTGLSVRADLDLLLINSTPGAGQDALSANSRAVTGTLPLTGAAPRSISLYFADDSGTALSSTRLSDLPELTVATFTNTSLTGDYILFGMNDDLKSGAQAEYSLTSLARRAEIAAATAVPEPASGALLLGGVLGMLWLRRVRAPVTQHSLQRHPRA